jgi:hypothetical protein
MVYSTTLGRVQLLYLYHDVEQFSVKTEIQMLRVQKQMHFLHLDVYSLPYLFIFVDVSSLLYSPKNIHFYPCLVPL